MNSSVLLRYHEIALKGENRHWFEERLGINARKIVHRHTGNEVEIVRENGRVILRAPWNEGTRMALDRVFGIANYSPFHYVPTSLDGLKKAAVDEFRKYSEAHGFPKTFRIFTKRSDKVLPEPSMEIDRLIGAAVLDEFPATEVQLKDPDLTIGIEVRRERSYLWTEKYPGAHGLPVGCNGRLLALLSGGIDSPVAAIQTLRRGVNLSYLHFYGAPFVGEEVLEKVEDLARLVNRYQPEPQPLHVVPFGKIQEQIALVTNPKMRTLLYRRMMLRIAEGVAQKVGALGLVTGESIGQVASQTVENLAAINTCAKLPVLRPLITYDKDEIIAQAKRYGTFETSVRPAVDCCTLFADRHPRLRTTAENIEAQEKCFPVEELVRKALETVEIRRIR